MNRSAPTGPSKPSVANHQGRQNSQPQFGPSPAHRNTRCPLNGAYAARGTMPAPPTQPRGPSGSPVIRSLPYNNTTNGMARESPPRGRPVLRRDDDWRTWQELTVKLMRLPLGIMTLDIYRLCSTEGSVQKIDLQVSKADCSAFVEFCPPPRRPFWESRCYMKTPHGQVPMTVDVMPRRRVFTHPSPVDPQIRYPERTVLYADSLDFGFMYDEASMMRMRTIYPTRARPVRFVLNLLRREIDIQLPLHLELSREARRYQNRQTDVHNYRFRLPIAQLQRIYEIPDGNEKRTLIIPFDLPPAFFRQVQDIESTHDTMLYWNNWQTWLRQTNVLNDEDRNPVAIEPIMLQNEWAIIDIGRWTTYRFVFDGSKNDRAKYAVIRRALTDYNIQFITGQKFDLKDKRRADFWDMLDMSRTKPSYGLSALEHLNSSTIPLDFAVRYQLEVCLSYGWLNEHNITKEFLKKLSAMKPEGAKYILEKAADRQCRIYNPMEIFDVPVIKNSKRNIPNYCVYNRAATVTPSMLYVTMPTVETSNRIIRQYIEYEDRFLRVKFTDEKQEGRVNGQDDNKFDEIFTRIKRAMTNGIVIGDRHYEFLAFGNSQFREHGAYFFASTDDLNAADIRTWMGLFSHIQIVAKYAARLGQCFSTTRAINGTTVKVETMPNIERNGYKFTDGVGKISRFLAIMIAGEFGLPNAADDYPSLFQFRLGGCKGVLAVAPDAKANEIIIRKSQYKFAATHQGLEIIRSSAFATATLNRQLIIVLSALGVPDQVFVVKQQEMLSDLSAAMTNETLALQKLQRNIDFNQMTLTIAAMILEGFMECKEPFMMSVLQLWRAWNIKFLKEKARIVIEKGSFLLGCVDETATLKGHFHDPQSRHDATRDEKLATLPEIFIQISNTDKRATYRVIEGICILARNPSLHPGDIRIVRAVDVPALRHLKNVVVLPQTGDRDVANMCSGGDLDGDDYLVMWDMDLLPPKINHPPMDYTAAVPTEVQGEVTLDQITTFFVTYMKNDSLGRIANAHLAQADFNDLGVLDQKCLDLAELHSCAVDYSKSGVPAKMPKNLIPRKYPHFMDNKYRPKDRIYQSKKVLGQLFDQVERADFVPQYEASFDKRILEAYDLDKDILKRAAEVKLLYDAAMRRIMAQHAIRTEFEVWSTFILDHNRESKDYTFAEELGRISLALKHRFQEVCREKAGARHLTDFDKLGPFVAAMYTVTAREMTEVLEECRKMKIVGDREVPMRNMDVKHMPLMSFPWIFDRDLGKIANGTAGGRGAATVALQGIQRRIGKKAMFAEAVPGQDVIETQGGITHRGEMLELFEDARVPEEVYDEVDEHVAMVERGIQGPALEKRQISEPFINRTVEHEDWAPEVDVLEQLQTTSAYNGSDAGSAENEDRAESSRKELALVELEEFSYLRQKTWEAEGGALSGPPGNKTGYSGEYLRWSVEEANAAEPESQHEHMSQEAASGDRRLVEDGPGEMQLEPIELLGTAVFVDFVSTSSESLLPPATPSRSSCRSAHRTSIDSKSFHPLQETMVDLLDLDDEECEDFNTIQPQANGSANLAERLTNLVGTDAKDDEECEELVLDDKPSTLEALARIVDWMKGESGEGNLGFAGVLGN